MEKVSLKDLEEMQKELFNEQCYLDIQKAMVKHFIKKKKQEQLILNGVMPMLKDCWRNQKPVKYKKRSYVITTIKTDGITMELDLKALELDCDDQYNIDAKDVQIF